MNSKKILLIDDEVDFLKLMGERIRLWGHTVLLAASGREGLDLIRAKEADIVILDYMMPDMDGIGVLKAIRKINKMIPVIMFTAHPDTESITKAEKLKVSSYVPKLSAFSDSHEALKSAIDMIARKLNR
ncbi:MAG: response regulator [Candidatus Omnitrophica bacterium]|nr:response regulator [Candidatus Omnitrophota bacterium]